MTATILTTNPAEIIYPEDDGNPMSDNTKQFQLIMKIQGGIIGNKLEWGRFCQYLLGQKYYGIIMIIAIEFCGGRSNSVTGDR